MCVFRVSDSGVGLLWFTFLPLVSNLLHYNEGGAHLSSPHHTQTHPGICCHD